MVVFIDFHLMLNYHRVDHHWDTYQPSSFRRKSCILFGSLVIWRGSETSAANPEKFQFIGCMGLDMVHIWILGSFVHSWTHPYYGIVCGEKSKMASLLK